MISSNVIPSIKDPSGAFPSRFLVLELKTTFYDNEDTALFGKLSREMPSILNWAIAGWARLKERGKFVEPASSQPLAREWRDAASPIQAFLRERTTKVPGDHIEVRVPCSELYYEWKVWNLTKGREHAGDEPSFGRALRAAFPGLKKSRPTIDGSRTNCYLDLRVMTPGEQLVREDEEADSDDAACEDPTFDPETF